MEHGSKKNVSAHEIITAVGDACEIVINFGNKISALMYRVLALKDGVVYLGLKRELWVYAT
jgi:hypothetical protein